MQLAECNSPNATRRMQLAECNSPNATRRMQLAECNSPNATCRKQLVEIEGRINDQKLTLRIITDYPQGLSSANYGLTFLNWCVKFSVLLKLQKQSVIIRRVNFWPFIRPLISRSCIRRAAFGKLHSTSCIRRVALDELFLTSCIRRVVSDKFFAYHSISRYGSHVWLLSH